MLGVDDRPGGPLAVHVKPAGPRPACLGCGTCPVVKDREVVELVDLPAFGRQTRLCWRKVRWACLVVESPMTTWRWADPRIAAPRQALTDRASRWVTLQVGRYGQSVAEVGRRVGLCLAHRQRRGGLLRRSARRRRGSHQPIRQVTTTASYETILHVVGYNAPVTPAEPTGPHESEAVNHA